MTVRPLVLWTAAPVQRCAASKAKHMNYLCKQIGTRRRKLRISLVNVIHLKMVIHVRCVEMYLFLVKMQSRLGKQSKIRCTEKICISQFIVIVEFEEYCGIMSEVRQRKADTGNDSDKARETESDQVNIDLFTTNFVRRLCFCLIV